LIPYREKKRTAYLASIPGLKMNNLPSLSNTCAIVVLFHPNECLQTQLAAIQRQVGLIIIVSNGISMQTYTALKFFLAENNSALLVDNPTNFGNAKALNQGMAIALEKGFSWVLLFDQDTTPNHDLLINLHETIMDIEPLPAMLGCNYERPNRGRAFISCWRKSRKFKPRKTLITSGTLLSTEAYRLLGPFCDHYFIDSIDHEYCLRARRNGLKVCISCTPLMSHAIGLVSKPTGSIFQRLQPHRHPPERMYYIIRNGISTLKNYGRHEPLWACRQVANLTMEIIFSLLIKDNRSTRLSLAWKGLKAGYRNQFHAGPLE
jgi:rhamnosyltransferase